MKCYNCQEETTNLKFCSSSCAATVNNKIPKKKKIIRTCLVCGGLCKKNAKKFCGLECSALYKWTHSTIPRFENGEIVCPKTLKKILIKLVGNVCSICSGTPWHNNKLLSLELHHIDENSDNNKPNNVCLICPNCHSQIKHTVEKKNTKRNRVGQLRKVSKI